MTVDVAEGFLETLVQAVERDRLRVKTRRNAHVIVNSVFGLRTFSVGVGGLARWIRSRRPGPRYGFVCDAIVQALRSGAWDTALTLNGLPATADRLPWHVPVQLSDATVTLKMAGSESGNGRT